MWQNCHPALKLRISTGAGWVIMLLKPTCDFTTFEYNTTEMRIRRSIYYIYLEDDLQDS
jgi:hypothetical protein